MVAANGNGNLGLLVIDKEESGVGSDIKKLRIQDNISASGQFSETELSYLLSLIPKDREIWIVDLRQESHAFINGTPVSWYYPKNQGNKNLSAEEIERLETFKVNELKNNKEVTAHIARKVGEGFVVSDEQVLLTPNLVETEKELVQRKGMNYKRFYVCDHHKPDDKTVEQFLEFYNSLPEKYWLHFHCRGGKGRSSTFSAMYYMLKNKGTKSFDEIIQLIEDVGGSKLAKVPSEASKQWKTKAAKDRYKFLQDFYNYTSFPQGLEVKTWSEWKHR